MKKMGLILISCLCLIGCDDSNNKAEEEVIEQVTPSIKVLEYDRYWGFHKIEIDGHWYFTASHGGTVHLESCPCHYHPEQFELAVGDTDEGV